MFSTSHGDTFNCPVEVAEARYGFDVLFKSLNLGEVPAEAVPGGTGVSLAYKLRAPATLSTGYSQAQVPIWATKSGLEGGRNSLNLSDQTEARITWSTPVTSTLQAATLFT